MPDTKVVQWPCGCQMEYSERSTDMTLVLRLLTWCPKHRIVTVLVGLPAPSVDDQLDRQQIPEPPAEFEQDPMNPCGATDPRF